MIFKGVPHVSPWSWNDCGVNWPSYGFCNPAPSAQVEETLPVYLIRMQQRHPQKSHTGLWLLTGIILPIVYLLSAPVVYVAGDKLGVHEQPLVAYCALYDWLEQNSPLWKPLTEYWMLWMHVGYA